MTKIGLDVGQARIGLAVSQGELVLPIESFNNTDAGLIQLMEELRFRSPEVIYVGLPLNLKGESTQSTKNAIDFARVLVESNFEVRLVDERLTTKTAQAKIHAAGKNVKQSRGYIDAQAAAAILEFALSSESDTYAGKALEDLDV